MKPSKGGYKTGALRGGCLNMINISYEILKNSKKHE